MKTQYKTLITLIFLVNGIAFCHAKYTTNYYTWQIEDAISRLKPDSPELFRALLTIHQQAYQNGDTIIYPSSDINHSRKTIHLTISKALLDKKGNFTSIPLANITDFNGWTFEVKACKDATDRLYIFSYSEGPLRNIDTTINGKTIDQRNFTSTKELKCGTKLLIVEDRTPWTYRNNTPDTYFPNGKPGTPWQYWNHDNPQYRKDILLLQNGVAQNRTITPYNTKASLPYCQYITVSDNAKEFKNIILHRTNSPGKVINLMHIYGANNVSLSNITINTDTVTAIHDTAISLINLTNVTVKDITIQKTYSTTTEYGYGIDMNNVWNAHFIQIVASSPIWGVFGCNNINVVRLDNCVINRFDLHLYGRDIACHNCTFRNDNYIAETRRYANANVTFNEKNPHIYNRFDALYGTLTYQNCLFDGFIPYRIDFGYNVFTCPKVTFRNCKMNIYQKKYAYLFMMGYWGAPDNEREEHAKRGWPDVEIDNMTICTRKGINDIDLFYLMDRETQRIPVHNRLVHLTSKLHVNDLRMLDMNTRQKSSTKLRENNLSYLIQFAKPVDRLVNQQRYTNSMLKLSNENFKH